MILRRRDDVVANPIWQRYVTEHMTSWLEWLRNIHIASHLELLEKFIDLHPHYVPSRDADSTDTRLVEKLLWNPEFINSLTDKGIQLWVVSNIGEFVDELRVYSDRFVEIKKVCEFIDSHIAWFERVYAFIRGDIVAYLREHGRSI